VCVALWHSLCVMCVCYVCVLCVCVMCMCYVYVLCVYCIVCVCVCVRVWQGKLLCGGEKQEDGSTPNRFSPSLCNQLSS